MGTNLRFNTGQHRDTQIIQTKATKTFAQKPAPKVQETLGVPTTLQKIQAKLMGTIVKGQK